MITERSRRGIDAYRFRIYPTGSDVQILHTESIKSARVLIIATSLWSFNLIRRHTFYIMFKSGDCAGEVIPGIAFSIFQSRVNLELCAGALSSWNINGCSAKCFATTGHKCTSRIFVICILLWINGTIYWYQSSNSIVRYAAPKGSWHSWAASNFA